MLLSPCRSIVFNFRCRKKNYSGFRQTVVDRLGLLRRHATHAYLDAWRKSKQLREITLDIPEIFRTCLFRFLQLLEKFTLQTNKHGRSDALQRKHTVNHVSMATHLCLSAHNRWNKAAPLLFPAQKFVFVSAELNYNRSPWALDFEIDTCCNHSFSWFVWIRELDRQSQPCRRGVTVGSCSINRLLFADAFLPLATSEQGLQHVHDRCSVTCDQAGMEISSKKTEVLCLSRHLKQRMLQVSCNTLQQVEKLKLPTLGWYSWMTESETSRLIYGLVKLTQFCVSFIALCLQNGSFQTLQSFQFMIWSFVRSSPMVMNHG